MASSATQLTYRYNPNQRSERGIIDDMIVDRYGGDGYMFHHYDAQTRPMPMRRFIDEPSCVPLCNAPFAETATLPPFHCLDIASYAYPTPTSWTYGIGPEHLSPSISGPSSSYFSSGASDRQSTPLSPPDSGFLTLSPEVLHPELGLSSFGGDYHFITEQKQPAGYPCVAMREVQSYEDLQPEKLAYDDTPYFGSHHSAAQEGYQPVEPNGDAADSGVETEDNDSKDDDYIPQSPNYRRRRPQSKGSVTCPRAPAKITKRSGHSRQSSASQTKSTGRSSSNNQTSSPTVRAFPCALANYGCNATFGSKNEWKRHVNTQHMRLAYWRCDQCDNSKKPNDFNRKDLFIQHVRRMHPVQTTPSSKKTAKQSGRATKGSPEDQTLTGLAERCFKQDRSPPDQSGCHFCETTFQETTGNITQAQWDKRLEHVAQHMESGKKNDNGASDPSTWRVDSRLQRWLLENRIVTNTTEKGLVLA